MKYKNKNLYLQEQSFSSQILVIVDIWLDEKNTAIKSCPLDLIKLINQSL